jgi:aminobenzoyl-glutamate utilization protein B
MQENMLRLGDPGFDEADMAFAAEIQKSLTPADIATSIRKFGIKVRKPDALHGTTIPRNDIHDSLGGSTDVGDVSWITPTAQCWGACYAVGTPFHTWQMVAQGKSPAAHKGMIHAAKVMASTALDVLRDPELRASARAELQERTGGEPYRCPIPNDVLPPPVRALRKEQSA